MKTCTGPCGQEKPLDQFYRLSKQKSGLNPQCKACVNAYNQAYNEANRDAMNRWQRQSAQRRWAKKIGVSAEQFAALLQRANDTCELCGRSERTVSKNGQTYALALDHDHTTGKPRGMLCVRCNSALGAVGDDPALLRRMAEYVENPPSLPAPIAVPKRVHTHSPETRAKMAAAATGRKSPFKGIPRSEEVRAKISETQTGQKRSDEARANMRAARLRFLGREP